MIGWLERWQIPLYLAALGPARWSGWPPRPPPRAWS
jgi:hypothetical protein